MRVSEQELDYDDVYLIPRKCVVESRLECDITVQLGKHQFSNPVIAANMSSVVDSNTCRYFAEKGMFYIMHRFLEKEQVHEAIRDMWDGGGFGSISVGIKDREKELLKYLKQDHIIPDYITVDVAHAHTDRVADMVKFIKDTFPKAFVIAGNVATGEAVQFLQDAGADAVKIFIGTGAACVLAGTMIQTKSGEKPIEKVVCGDEVLTHKNRYKIVVDTHRKVEKERIYVVNGVRCTADHKFYVVSKKHKDIVTEENVHDYAIWKRADEIDDLFLIVGV